MFSLNSDTQFTLTCISIGGPATTVTWTRRTYYSRYDQVTTITEGTNTVLDDPVTAQYTHTLSMTGRQEVLYRCTVSNEVSPDDTAALHVQG